MPESLEHLFETITVPSNSDLGGLLYAIKPVPGRQDCYIGKDSDAHACFLVATVDRNNERFSPRRYKDLDVQYGLLCNLEKVDGISTEERLTVIRCRTSDEDTIRYFLSACNTILSVLGDEPTQKVIDLTVRRLASIFQKMQKPPTKTVNGLFGELYLIYRSASPIESLAAWRSDDAARFDFVAENIRLDVKVTERRMRAHVFSYEQCNPPAGTVAIAASMFVERSPGGVSLLKLVDGIVSQVASDANLIFKLHEVMAATLGSHLGEAMAIAYDTELADSSLCFYYLDNVPAVREPLPANVSAVHFRSDLSSLKPVSISVLREAHAELAKFLPARR